MKKIIYYLLGLSLIITACETIEDSQDLGEILTEDQLDIEIIQQPAGSNTVVLKNNTTGIIPYWDWGTGWSNKIYAEVYLPFAGNYTVEFTAFCEGGSVTTSREFTVDNNDNAFFDTDPAWKMLTGGGPGKTWVWATDHPTGLVFGNGMPDCVTPQWWMVKPSDEGFADYMGQEVYMDLNSAANFELRKADGSVVKGVFKVVDQYAGFSAIKVLGGPAFSWPTSGQYHFTLMTEDELSVHDYASYNVALYKRKGFNY